MHRISQGSSFVWPVSYLQNTHKAEQEKYGIYFDDDYDYLQHLRGVREAVEWDNLDLEVYTIRNEDTKVNIFVSCYWTNCVEMYLLFLFVWWYFIPV